MNNTKQIALGWIIYASDFDDHLVPNHGWDDVRGGRRMDGWHAGVLDFNGANPDNTNTLLLTETVFAPYVSKIKKWHDPRTVEQHPPDTYGQFRFQVHPNNVDLIWLLERSSAPKPGR
jgi:hypothetical protein